jgi:hypothetical protein
MQNMDSGSNDVTFNTEIYYRCQPPYSIITRNDTIKFIIVKLLLIPPWLTEVEKMYLSTIHV